MTNKDRNMITSTVKRLAITARLVADTSDETMDDVVVFIVDECNKTFNKYREMGDGEFLIEMMTEMLRMRKEVKKEDENDD